MAYSKHQLDLLDALNKIPAGTEFCVKDVRDKYGYPYKDASSVLQSSRILSTFVEYAPEYYKNGAIHYVKDKMFDFWYNLAK